MNVTGKAQIILLKICW